MSRHVAHRRPLAAVSALTLVVAALTLVASPAAGYPWDPSQFSGVNLYVEDGNEQQPSPYANTAGENSYIPFYLHIYNSTGSVVSGATLWIDGPGDNELLTEGCQFVTDHHECPLEDIYGPDGSYSAYDPGTLVAIQSLSPAASASPVTTTFTIVLPAELSEDPGDHTDSIDFLIQPDVLSLWMTSYPQAAPSGGTLEYQARIKNGSVTTATGVVLQVRFGDCFGGAAPCGPDTDYQAFLDSDPITAPTSCTPITADDPSSDLYDIGRPWLATCTLPNVAPGEIVLPIRMTGPTCITPPGGLNDCVVDTSFRITYAEMGTAGETFRPNDEDYKPAYVRPEDTTSGQDAVTQASDLPLAESLTTTSLDGDGLATTDPTAVAVTLPSTFTGSAAVTETDEASFGGGAITIASFGAATADGTTSRFTTTSRPSSPPPPTVRSCFDAEYGMDCQSVDFTLASPIERTGLVYRLRFLFHPSLFVNPTTGRTLKITSISMFHDYELVLSCPKGTTLLNYNSKWPEGIPCLSARRLTKTGNYEFIIFTGINGNWKPGR